MILNIRFDIPVFEQQCFNKVTKVARKVFPVKIVTSCVLCGETHIFHWKLRTYRRQKKVNFSNGAFRKKGLKLR